MAEIAQVIHVNGGCAQQHRLFQHAQAFARTRHLALGRAGSVGGLIAVVEVLRDGEARTARCVGAVNFGPDELCRRAALRAVDVGVLIACARSHRDLGAITGQRLRHVLVGGADLRALCVELWIVLIGTNERCLDRVGQGGRRTRICHQEDRSRSRGDDLHPIHPWFPFICPRPRTHGPSHLGEQPFTTYSAHKPDGTT